MANPSLDEARPLGDEAETLPEAERALLRVNVHGQPLRRIGEHAPYQGCPDGAPALRRDDRDALDLPTVRRGASASSCHGLSGDARQEVLAYIVQPIQLQLGRYVLLLHEHSMSDRAPERPIRV